jgi:hypothetical protein
MEAETTEAASTSAANRGPRPRPSRTTDKEDRVLRDEATRPVSFKTRFHTQRFSFNPPAWSIIIIIASAHGHDSRAMENKLPRVPSLRSSLVWGRALCLSTQRSFKFSREDPLWILETSYTRISGFNWAISELKATKASVACACRNRALRQ